MNKEALLFEVSFLMFYNICFSQLTDQMNDYMATFQLLGRYLPQISNPDFGNW